MLTFENIHTHKVIGSYALHDLIKRVAAKPTHFSNADIELSVSIFRQMNAASLPGSDAGTPADWGRNAPELFLVDEVTLNHLYQELGLPCKIGRVEIKGVMFYIFHADGLTDDYTPTEETFKCGP